MQSIFKRYEEKYLITKEQGDALQNIAARRMETDRFGEYLVQNLYYDDEDWNIIRTSLEKPLYKEKMRLRCYGVPDSVTDYFLELKKKYDNIVYKRRIAVPANEFTDIRSAVSANNSQISRELDFYLTANKVTERIYIGYNRLAFNGDDNLRITFDTDVRFRINGLDFRHPGTGHRILRDGKMLMEIKTLGGMPLWLAHTLSDYKIYPTAFSKFGVCYTDYIKKKEIVIFSKPERTVRISV